MSRPACLILALMLSAAAQVHAICPFDNRHVIVGDQASDCACDYNDLQSAIGLSEYAAS